MKLEKLQHLENEFFKVYPEGFDAPDLQEIAKKHKMDKMQTFVKENFAKDKFESTEEVFEDFVKLISKSSLVSVLKNKVSKRSQDYDKWRKRRARGGNICFFVWKSSTGVCKTVGCSSKI